MSNPSFDPAAGMPNDGGRTSTTYTFAYDSNGILVKGDHTFSYAYDSPSLSRYAHDKVPLVLVRLKDGTAVPLAAFLATKNCDVVVLLEEPQAPSKGGTGNDNPTSGRDEEPPKSDTPTMFPREPK